MAFLFGITHLLFYLVVYSSRVIQEGTIPDPSSLEVLLLTDDTLPSDLDLNIYLEKLALNISNDKMRIRDSHTKLQSSHVKVENDIVQAFEQICIAVERTPFNAILSFVSYEAVEVVSLISSHLHVPVFDFGRRLQIVDSIANQYYLSMYPSLSDSARVLVLFLNRFALYKVAIVRDESSSSSDYFFRKLQTEADANQVEIAQNIIFDPSDPDIRELLASQFSGTSFHMAAICLTPENTDVFFSYLRSVASVDLDRFVWIIMELSFTNNSKLMSNLPTGSVAIQPAIPDTPKNLAKYALRTIAPIVKELKTEQLQSNSKFRMTSCVGESPNPTFGAKLYRKILNSTGEYDSNGFRLHGPYTVFNLIDVNKRKEWRRQGLITSSNDIDSFQLNSIVWPGNNYFLPQHKVDTRNVRVVLKSTKPFVDKTNQFVNDDGVHDRHECEQVGIACLQVNTSVPEILARYLDNTLSGAEEQCCFGLTIDLLKRLARDMNLKYVAFLNAEKNVGRYVNGTGWEGMVGNILRGSADIAAGATSITPEREAVVNFVPYYQSAFGILSIRNDPDPHIAAFMDPFSWQMWCLIFIFVKVTAIFIGLFEWFSPYGLHPAGRNRSKTFSFPSALLHTWSLLFSHTYNSKPPKSVASRIIVSAWGMFAVVFIAGYTANLASFMAGRMLQTNIDISELRNPGANIKLGTVSASSTAHYLKLYFAASWSKMEKYNVKDIDEGVRKLKSAKIKALMFDSPVVKYHASTDPECKLIAAGSNFWSDIYGLGLPKGSPLKDRIANFVIQYEAAGLITTWEKKWLSESAICYASGMQESYHLTVSHAYGVFVLIAIGVVLAVFVLLLEWAVYKWVVPELRKRKREGNWKYVLFFSQRLNATLQSADIMPPGKSLKRALKQAAEGVSGSGGRTRKQSSAGNTPPASPIPVIKRSTVRCDSDTEFMSPYLSEEDETDEISPLQTQISYLQKGVLTGVTENSLVPNGFVVNPFASPKPVIPCRNSAFRRQNYLNAQLSSRQFSDDSSTSKSTEI